MLFTYVLIGLTFVTMVVSYTICSRLSIPFSQKLKMNFVVSTTLKENRLPLRNPDRVFTEKRIPRPESDRRSLHEHAARFGLSIPDKLKVASAEAAA